MATKTQLEEKKSLLSSFLTSNPYSQTPMNNGQDGIREEKVRRRRKKVVKSEEEAKKRRLTDDQLRFLEMSFNEERKLETGRKEQLATELGLDPKQVAVWFQNRRARWKIKLMEDEFSKLKSAYDTAILHNSHLQNEVLTLKERLSDVEEKIRKLSGPQQLSGRASGSRSPCSSLSTVTDQNQKAFLGEFGVGGEVDLMYMPEYNYNNYMMEWANNLYEM